jgi:23S rRNA (cytidine1920-2'-O)/16S rRNA (cytidine1409-2'-O)-methyltransferase
MAPRADTLLAERGLFESRAKAREAIEAGLVRAGGRLVKKPSEDIAPDAELSAAAPYPWVSRGGVKLAHALEAFGVDPSGRYCLDVGASTGGFTDVLLTRGARHVVAVDVGHGQLHPRIRGDARVTALERLDARALDRARLAEPPSLIVCDASFISLTLILPNVLALAAPEATLIALIKPQFEAGRAAVKKGVVRDALAHAQVCARIAQEVERLGWRVMGPCPSPIEGGDGNREFLLCGQKS